MIIEKALLQMALEKVKPGLSSKEILLQSNNFAFFGDRVVTYNDEISVSCPVPGLDITGAVKSDELYKFITKAAADKIDISIQESEIHLKAGRAKVGLAFNPEVLLPLTELGEVSEKMDLPEDFLFGLTSVLFCVGNDMTRPRLTCVHCREDGILEACDNSRFIQYTMKDVLPEFLIPGSSVRELLKYSVKRIGFTEGWAHFWDDSGVSFSCRLFSDEYPVLENNMKNLHDAQKIVFPEDLDAVLTRAQIFVAKTDLKYASTVDISVEGRKMFIRAEMNGAWFEEWVKVEPYTPPCAFSVNPVFLQDIMKRNTSCQFYDGKCVIFKGENWLHMAALQTRTDK